MEVPKPGIKHVSQQGHEPQLLQYQILNPLGHQGTLLLFYLVVCVIRTSQLKQVYILCNVTQIILLTKYKYHGNS